MTKPFKTFMAGIVDYAGLFPPAGLPMDTAIRNYARFRKEGDAWMLSRFICPAARLKELQPYKAILFQEGEPFRFSVLIRPAKDEDAFLRGLAKDIEAIEAFIRFHDGRVVVDAIEAKIPTSLLDTTPQKIGAFLEKAAAALEGISTKQLQPFYEAEFTSHKNWESILRNAITAVSDHNQYVQGSGLFHIYSEAGFKIRCGGTEPQHYPTPEQLAFAIDSCLRQKVAMKGTAGLHHPVRHFNKEAMVKMHGFLNFFGAAIVAEAHDLDLTEIQEIIEDENPENFIFSKRAFAWHGLRTSSEEVQQGRDKVITSFGSCSFDEPRDDLRNMRLL